ncbi:MAG: response regulator transcription factor [Chloroflexaceae bacterium]|nr:response regulator transcription factor [Chloroflexaceae bacterium]
MSTIVLADDHQVVRLGMRTLLEAEEDFSVVGEASDGLEADRLVERLKPDILIVDLMMPGINGLEVTRHVGQRVPGTRIIILSMHATESYVLEALRHGASAYVLKESSANDIVHAVREVLAGRRYLSPPLSERAIEIYVRQASEETVLDPYEKLTNREREVLYLAAQGYYATEIAEQLSISPRTAEVHRSNLMRKLGLHSKTDLIRFALSRGIIPLDETLCASSEDWSS